MAPRGYLIDTNLLILFVVGSESRDIIARHRRLKGYSAADYDKLRQMIDSAGRIVVTPNTLTEASNLIRQHGEPERSGILNRLRNIIEQSQELVVASTAAARNPEFRRLGLTDAVLLEVATEDTPLITVDLGLYIAALQRAGEKAAFNFINQQEF